MPRLANKSETPLSTLIRLIISLALLLICTIALGKLSLISAVKDIDKLVFEFSVRNLQKIPGAIDYGTRLTRLGALNINYSMAIALGALIGLQRRRLDLAVLVVVSMTGAHAFQDVVKAVVDGTIPPDSLATGPAGPYYSGGVQRVMLLAGMVATLAQTEGGWSDKFVYRIAIAVGVFEAITRLALGRHWPFDLVVAFPIGLAFVWGFRTLLELVDDTFRPSHQAPPTPTTHSTKEQT